MSLNITVCTPTVPSACVTYTPPATITPSACVSVGSIAQVCMTTPAPQPEIKVTSTIVGSGFIDK